ncbi:c-type cytochrome [Bdellovibrio sp. ArHS]|uniref:c-type cytochrome n=1 Tax=Bdellovibrio sp. ArHS TaxID=1569284 RepID=UPI000A8E89C2|nr:c-type cytochrome [Bdellovibrio sp. ArHS]
MKKAQLGIFLFILALGAIILQERSWQQTLEPLSTDIKPIERNDMLDAADIQVGREISHNCTACHSFSKDGPNKTGPNLFGIVGAKIARRKDFEYSDALMALRGKTWSIAELDHWLKEPDIYVPGTKMSSGGIADPQDRMDLIAYLMTLK